MCSNLVKVLENKKIIIKDKKSKIIKSKNCKNPIIIVKPDGGIVYDLTDLCAINYKINN